jgi:hypothetical protein
MEARKRAHPMRKQKYCLAENKWRIVLFALNELRNKRIAEGKRMETVNDTIIAFVNAKTKMVLIAGRRRSPRFLFLANRTFEDGFPSG